MGSIRSERNARREVAQGMVSRLYTIGCGVSTYEGGVFAG